MTSAEEDACRLCGSEVGHDASCDIAALGLASAEVERLQAERDAATRRAQDLARALGEACDVWTATLDAFTGFVSGRVDEVSRYFGPDRAIIERLRALAAPLVPANWLDCSDCRARFKSGAKPPRCEVHASRDTTAKPEVP